MVSRSNLPSGGEFHTMVRRAGLAFTVAVLMLMAWLLMSCASDEPRPYTIAGEWSGTAAAGSITVTLAQTGQAVTGTGRFTRAGEVERGMTLPNGQLNADSTLFVTASSTPDGVNMPCSGQLQGTYRMAQHNANSFVAQFMCGAWSLQATLSRE